MAAKRILVVDDEKSLLFVLREKLERLDSSYEVFTASDGFAALKEMESHTFDLIITDYKMAGMDGLELLASIRFKQPNARVVLMTAYSSDALESEARRLQAYNYLTKPLDMKAFGALVQDALGEVAVSRPGILIMSDERYQRVHKLLEKLRMDASASCAFLADANGQSLARAGNVEKLPMEEIASLLGGGVATLMEVGRTLDGQSDAVNLIYREGKKEYLYATNVGQNLLLILLIDRTPYSTRLGSVWYYAQQTTADLCKVVGEAEYASPQDVFGDSANQDFGQEIDKLLMGD